MGIIDYSTLTDLHLLTLLAVLRAWTWEALVRVIDPPELDIFIGFFRKWEAVATLPGHGRSLTRVRPFCSDDRPLQFLAWLGVQQQPPLSELEKRLAPRTVGNVLLNTSPYAEPCTGVRVRKVAKAEWSAAK